MAGSKGYNTRAYVSAAPGAFAIIPTSDFGTVQPALPSVLANSTTDYYAVVPNSGSQWKVQKSVNYMRSDGTTETAGIVLSKIDCIQPEYPGAGQAVTSASNTWFVMNGYLFLCTTSGTTASPFIGFAAFNKTKGATTTDGTAVWTSYGKAALLRFLFGNVSASPATPVAQTYELFQS